MANLVAAYAVDLQPDFFTGAAPALVWSEGFGRVLPPVPGTSRIPPELESGSVVCEEMGLDESAGIKLFPYHRIPDYEGSKGRGLATSRFQPGNLELIPWDAMQPGRLLFDLRWDRSRSSLCFGFDDALLVDGGTLVASYRRGVDVDGGTITDNWFCGIHSISS